MRRLFEHPRTARGPEPGQEVDRAWASIKEEEEFRRLQRFHQQARAEGREGQRPWEDPEHRPRPTFRDFYLTTRKNFLDWA